MENKPDGRCIYRQWATGNAEGRTLLDNITIYVDRLFLPTEYLNQMWFILNFPADAPASAFYVKFNASKQALDRCLLVWFTVINVLRFLDISFVFDFINVILIDKMVWLVFIFVRLFILHNSDYIVLIIKPVYVWMWYIQRHYIAYRILISECCRCN